MPANALLTYSTQSQWTLSNGNAASSAAYAIAIGNIKGLLWK